MCYFILIKKGNKKWDEFYSLMLHDSINWWCYRIVQRFKKDHQIIFVTGRPEKYRTETIAWLRTQNICDDVLLMRKDNDFRKDCVIKEEIYREHIESKYEVEFCIDDRKQVVDMWRSIGLTCLQCAEGNF